MKSYRILGITGILAFAFGSVFKYMAFIPDMRRSDFATPQEELAYDEAWNRGEMHLLLQKEISERNAAIFKYSLLAVSASILALSFRKRSMPNGTRQDRQSTEVVDVNRPVAPQPFKKSAQ